MEKDITIVGDIKKSLLLFPYKRAFEGTRYSENSNSLISLI